MTERKLSPGTASPTRWIAVGIVTLFVASAALGVVLLAPAGAGATGSPAAPALAQDPTCTVTVDTETGPNNAIQSAIDTYGPLSSPSSPVTICIGPGTFPEELTITGTTDLTILGSGNTSTILDPATPVANGYDPDQGVSTVSIIQANDDSGLTIANVGINGTGEGTALDTTCSPGLLGIFFYQSSGTISGDSVLNVSTDTGCQEQSAILIDTGASSPDSTPIPETVAITANTVTNYGKNGIGCFDVGVVCTVADNTVVTTAMPLGLAATNGIVFSLVGGSIDANYVAGNTYLPGACLGGDYFSSGEGCASPYWSGGILVLSSPDAITIDSNVLANDQVGIWVLGSPSTVDSNTILPTGIYGIVLDFNVSDVGGASSILAPTPWSGIASYNQISGQNVGMLGYDDNVTFDFDQISQVNVGIEIETDVPIHVYQETMLYATVSANVSGALLGDASSYSPGANAQPNGNFEVGYSSFTNASTSPTGSSSGIALYGDAAWIGVTTVTGFDSGISTVTVSASTTDDDTVSGPTAYEPSSGIYMYGGVVVAVGDVVHGFSWMNGPGWWPNSQSTGIFVQGLDETLVEYNDVSDNALGIVVDSYAYGPFPAPDWPYAAAPTVGPVSVIWNTVTNSGAFGIAFDLNQFSGASFSDAPTTTVVQNNTVDNTLTGAVGLMVDQGIYAISDNTFVGTSTLGATGVSQPTPNGPIGTDSIQVLNVGDSATIALLGTNTYEDTSLYTALLNVTTAPQYFATIIGAPPMSAPASPVPSATALDDDQALTVTATIPTDGAAPYAWTWLVSTDGGSYGTAGDCAVSTGSNAAAGTVVTCAIGAGDLTVGDYYAFELRVADGSTSTVTLDSMPSATVNVYAALSAPNAPTPSAAALDADQSLTVTAGIPDTGAGPFAWTWLVSKNGGTPGEEMQCGQNSGSGASAGATVACVIPGGSLSAGASYAFRLQVTDSATSPETTISPSSALVIVSSALVAPSAPSLSATALDLNQALTVQSVLAASGTAPYTWEWLVSVNGGSAGPATACATDSGSSASAATITCAIGAGDLLAGDSYVFALKVTDSATHPESLDSPTSDTVTVATALAAPARPTVNRPALDVNQALTVSGKLPTTGTASYAWTWLISTDDGAFVTATVCGTNSGSAGVAGATVTCVIAAGRLTPGDYYNFELKVHDSATAPESKTSKETSETVTVASELTAPATPKVSATALDADQTLTVTDTLPSTGTTPYAWTWLVSVDGAAYATASICAVPSGTGGTAAGTVVCTIAPGTLTSGDHYAFKLKVTDAATAKETATSAASAAVKVHSELEPSLAPKVSLTRIDVAQPLTVTAKLPTTGTSPYAWQWEVSVNGAPLTASGYCTENSGTGGASGATVTCSIPGSTLTSGDTYWFAITVTDSASHAEVATSAESHSVTVA